MTALDQAFIRAYSRGGTAQEATQSPVVDPPAPRDEAPAEMPPVVPESAPTMVAEPRVSLRTAAAVQGPTTASMERLFTNLARSADQSAAAVLPRARSVFARETLGLVRPPAWAGARPQRVVAPPPQVTLPPAPDRVPLLPPRETELPRRDEHFFCNAVAHPQETDAAAEKDHSAPPEQEAVAVAELAAVAEAVVPPSPLSVWPPESDEPEDSAVCDAGEKLPALPAALASWQPMLQVDHFVWPRICAQLQAVAARQMGELADALADAAGDHKVLAVGGCRAGDGATTMLLCAARLLAQRGFRVLLADAAFDDPQLARRLGMAPQAGWEEVLAGRLPLEEVIIDSTADRLAVLPAVKPSAGDGGDNSAGSGAGLETGLAASLDVLKQHYDFILVDAGPLQDRCAAGLPALGSGSGLDAAIVIHNLRTTSAERLAEVQAGLSAAGVVQIGVIQNFVRS